MRRNTVNGPFLPNLTVERSNKQGLLHVIRSSLLLRTLGLLVLLATFCLTLSSCFTLIAAASEDIKQSTAIKNEVAQLGGRKAKWRSELAYDEDKKGGNRGIWYGTNILGWKDGDLLLIGNLDNGVSLVNIRRSTSYAWPNYALVASDDKPAGETSLLTLKELGSTTNITYTVSYMLSADGNSFTITDLGGLNHSLLKKGTYISRKAKQEADNKVLEGYGAFSVRNQSSNHSITMISIAGGKDRRFSQTYQVNLGPAASGVAGVLGGGSFTVGERIAGKTVIPIGDYEVKLRWSNGAETTDRVTITSRGLTGNYSQ